jgi:hypothetical protein
MPFAKINTHALPPRHWALVGFPGSGKSTLAATMAAPLLVVDADHRFAEVAHLVDGDVLSLSDQPADHVQAERIAALLKENMPGATVKTIVIDALTSILTPLVVEAILANDAGKHKNRVASFKPKALAMRLLQDTITGWGCDVLWIYHLRTGLDGHAKEVESTTISVVELARLRRSLNMQLRIVQEGQRRGVHVDWARRGRSGLTLWDDSNCWRGMPERIERAVYGGLTPAQMNELERQAPTSFSGPEAAIAWGYEQGCFKDAAHAANAYEKVKRERAPKTPVEMWKLWIEEVERRKLETEQG